MTASTHGDLATAPLRELVRELVNRRRSPDDDLPIADLLRLAVLVETQHAGGATLDAMVATVFEVERDIGAAARDACHGVAEAVIRSYLTVDAHNQEKRERELRALAYQRRQEAMTDYLTGLANRAAFDSAMQRELARARRHGRALSLLLLDIDDLKGTNDRYLHHTGDEAIRAVAQIVARAVRASDICARLGGDEFGVAMPEAGVGKGQEVVARVRAALAAFNREHRLPQPLELSIGLAEWDGDQSYAELFDAADKRLYTEKRRHKRASGKLGGSQTSGPSPSNSSPATP